MSYVEKILQPDEKLVYVTRLHWFVYLPAICCAIVALACLVLTQNVSGNVEVVVLIVAAAFGILALVAWLRGALARFTTELAVTDRRVVFKRGLLQRHTMEMNLGKVESVDVDQSILGRMMGYGTVTLRGTGGGLEPLRNISDPIAFRNHVTAA